MKIPAECMRTSRANLFKKLRNSRVPVAFPMSILLLGLSACAPSKPLYYGLNENSYGAFTVTRDQEKQIDWIPSCDPNHKYEDTAELARQITAAIFKPVSGTEKLDQLIVVEGLQDNFKMPGDPGGMATVAILDRNPDKIVFWHDVDLVSLDEVKQAGAVYCKKFGRTAAYAGTAKQCGQPEMMPVRINGQTTHIPTFAITRFVCEAPVQAQPPAPAPKKHHHKAPAQPSQSTAQQ